MEMPQRSCWFLLSLEYSGTELAVRFDWPISHERKVSAVFIRKRNGFD
jgi:hypothetical protein